MLLTQEQLIDCLQKHLAKAERLDFAVAWASPSDALAQVTAFGRKHPGCLRSIVGICGSATHPSALRDLQRDGEIRIPQSNPLFHPKLFLFHRKQRNTVWVGSANLSRCGFQQNTELVYEFEDDGTAIQWFERLWSSLRGDDHRSRIDAYERAWKPAGSGPRKPADVTTIPSRKELLRIFEEARDWPSFVNALRAASLYWTTNIGFSVDGETGSWLNTITLGNAVVRRADWDHLTKYDYQLIMGIESKVDRADTGYGLLGSMTSAGRARNIFIETSKKNLRVRKGIRNALQPIFQVPSSGFSAEAIKFIRTVMDFEGFGSGIATRLLTLARPELAVSVNEGSRDGLVTLLGLDAYHPGKNSSAPDFYASVLSSLAKQPWYSSPAPRTTYERSLMDARAALLDCLVYSPRKSS